MPSSENERRKEMRAEVPVQLSFNILSSRRDYIRTQPSKPVYTDTEPATALEGRTDLERFLLRLDKKLDHILAVMTDSFQRKDYAHQGRLLDISENGLRFFSPVALPEGTVLEAGLIMPNKPHHTMDFCARVMWEGTAAQEEDGDSDRLVGLEFVNILTEDQDTIVHYLFQKQREELRKRKEAENAGD
jgi:hypothetical protein